MSYHQDWLMRQIEAISAMLAYMLTGKKPDGVTVEDHLNAHAGTNQLYLRLHILIQKCNICHAENLLYEAMEESDPEVPEAAVLFYNELNALSDEILEKSNFSREEILDGLKDISAHYGLPV